MRPPLPLRHAPHFPVTAGVALLAIVVTLVWWSGRDITAFTMDVRAWHGEPWRLVSSALPHVNFLHLAFNLYWLWVFGTALEQVYGWARTFLLILVLAAFSSAAEYAFFVGGVGLSGVGYGLCTYAWIAGRGDRRLCDVVDRSTLQLFAGWFVLCIVTTAMGIWNVANVAHGAGAVGGLVLGRFGAGRRQRTRIVWSSLGAVMFLATVLAATIGRPYVNLAGPEGARDLAWLGYEALREGDAVRAEDLYVRAVRMNDRDAGSWYNLAIAQDRQAKYAQCVASCDRALSITPLDSDLRSMILTLRGMSATRVAAPPGPK